MFNKKVNLRMSRLALACTVAVSVVGMTACGSNEETAATSTLEIAGVAATGAAMSGAAVSVKCATGTATATASSAGAYSVNIDNGSLPCAVRATSTDNSTVLHSAIEGSGAGKVNVNVTPMSDLIVSQTQGAAASVLFEQFDANKDKLTAANLGAAKDKVRAALALVTDLTGIDPIKDVLVAANGNNPGNDLDKRLDTLRDTLLASQTKLPELAAAILANANGSVGEIIRTITRPRSSACAGFHSGAYRVIEPSATPQVYDITFNAATLTATTPNGSVQMTANNCELTAPDNTKVVLSKSGFGVMRTSNGTLAAIMPKQTLKLDDFAGTWNWVRREKSSLNASYEVAWGETLFNSAGVATADSKCKANSSTCQTTAAANLPSIALSSDGGFTIQGSSDKFYGFRTANGSLAVMGVSSDGGLMFARTGPAANLPTVGDVHKRTDIGVSSVNVVDSDFFRSEFTVTSVDAANKTFTRKRTSDCRVDTLKLGSPFAFSFSRELGTSANCTTGTINFPKLVGINGNEIGVAAYVVPATNALGFTVRHE